MVTRTVDIYEGPKKILRHVFYGDTPREAKSYEDAHRASDAFFRAALEHRAYKGVRPRARRV